MTPISLTTTREIDGCVKLNSSWAELSDIARLDLLGDWVGVLNQLYALCHDDTYGHGFDWQNNLVEAISGWDNHGKAMEDYRPSILGERP